MQIAKVFILGLGIFLILGLVFAHGTQNTNKNNGFGLGIKQKVKDKVTSTKHKIGHIKEKTKAKLKKFENIKTKWKQTRLKTHSLKLMLQSKEGRAATANYVKVLGYKISNHFLNLANKNGPFAQVWKEKAKDVNEIVKKLDSNSDSNSILKAIKDLKKVWSEKEAQRKALIGERFIEKANKVVPKMENLLNKLDQQMDAMEKSDINTELARTQFNKANESIVNLKLDLIKTHTQLETFAKDKNANINTINSLIKELNTRIHNARDELVKTLTAFNKLKSDYMKNLKETKDNIKGD